MKLKSKTRNTVIGVIVLVVAIAAIVAITTPIQRKPAPNVALSLLNGSKPMLADYRGRTVLATFWSVSCTVCAEEIPHLNELYQQKNNYNLEIIGLNMPYDRPDWTVSFVKKRKMLYPVSLDLKGEIARAFGGIQLTPTTVLIDQQGNIVWKRTGRTDFVKLKKELITLSSER